VRYRVLGRTGLKVSELGVGGHEYRRPLPTTLGRWGEIDLEKFMKKQPERNELIGKAIEAGINFFDATQPEEAKSLGLALKELGARRDVYAAVMILRPFIRMAERPDKEWRDFIIDDVEDKLKLLQSDYADILNVHMPERGYTRKRMSAALEVFEELKETGKIGSLGASSHEPRVLAELLQKYDCFDSVMIKYNYHLQEAREVIFPLCKALNIGVVIMKPLCWPYYGIPFMRFGPVEGEELPSTPAQICIRWILSFPEVSTVVPSMNSLAELEENVAAITQEVEVDETLLDKYLKIAQGPQVKKKLLKMLEDPDKDIRHFAKRTLND